ncbi:MAG: endonuclease domain-containing protein [Deltaproteobacteria bacterium]|nr:endonuclease domain-containing protein [Deltaproteobacteria bacterium]
MHPLRGTRATTSLARHLRRRMTAAEVILWRELRDRRLGVQFRRQHALEHFVLDFFAPSCLLAIEIDGPVHTTRGERDSRREAWLSSVGVRTLRYGNDDVVNELAGVIAEVRAALVAARPSPQGRGRGGGLCARQERRRSPRRGRGGAAAPRDGAAARSCESSERR